MVVHVWVASYASCSAGSGGELRPRPVEHCALASERDAVRAVLSWMDVHRDVLERDADLTCLMERCDPASREVLVTDVLTPERLECTASISDLADFVGDFQRRLDTIVATLGADGPGSALDLRISRVEVGPGGAQTVPVLHTGEDLLCQQ